MQPADDKQVAGTTSTVVAEASADGAVAAAAAAAVLAASAADHLAADHLAAEAREGVGKIQRS
jgi:hypothetical protein